MENRRRKGIYLLLLLIQVIGAGTIFWDVLPDFQRLIQNPGQQPAYDRYENFAAFGAFSVMQVAYWYRLCRLPIPVQRSNLILNHILLFLGRLSFIFGAALFSVVFFRHLPELDHTANGLLMVKRGLLLVGVLFALFCLSLELERLGNAFGSSKRD